MAEARPGLMVFADDLSLAGLDAGRTIAAPILSYAGGSLPPGWAEGGRRFGGSFTGPSGSVEPVAWQQGRLLGKCSVRLQGGRVEVDVSLGWRFLGRAHAIESSRAYELVRLGGKLALASLMRDVTAARYDSQISGSGMGASSLPGIRPDGS